MNTFERVLNSESMKEKVEYGKFNHLLCYLHCPTTGYTICSNTDRLDIKSLALKICLFGSD